MSTVQVLRWLKHQVFYISESNVFLFCHFSLTRKFKYEVFYSNLVTIGTCMWMVPEFCCERRADLFYIFDWNTKTWSNEYTTTVTPAEYPGSSVQVSSKFLQSELDCVGIKWPKCIRNGTSGSSYAADLTLDAKDMQLCAKICATSVNCQLWKYSEELTKCWIYNFNLADNHDTNTDDDNDEVTLKYGSKDCFEKV